MQCAVVAMTCVYWSYAVTDIFARHLARFRVTPAVVMAPAPAVAG